MHRAETLYVGTIVVLIVGLWATITAGSRLRPPHDISGAWTLSPEGGSCARQKLCISQSGRFVLVQSETLGSLHLRLADNAVDPAEGTVLMLRGARPISIRIPSRGSPEYQFQMDGMTYAGKRIAARDAGQPGRHE